jgi:putative FmdB family regulatory protein
MPVYIYRCQSCNHQFEEFQKVAETPLTKCPNCDKLELVRVICPPILTIVTDEPKTVGMLAERNSKKMSDEEMKIKEFERTRVNPVDNTPEFLKQHRTKTEKDIRLMDKKQRERYINEGR